MADETEPARKKQKVHHHPKILRIDTVPTELLLRIVSFLSANEVFSLQYSSPRLKQAINLHQYATVLPDFTETRGRNSERRQSQKYMLRFEDGPLHSAKLSFLCSGYGNARIYITEETETAATTRRNNSAARDPGNPIIASILAAEGSPRNCELEFRPAENSCYAVWCEVGGGGYTLSFSNLWVEWYVHEEEEWEPSEPISSRENFSSNHYNHQCNSARRQKWDGCYKDRRKVVDSIYKVIERVRPSTCRNTYRIWPGLPRAIHSLEECLYRSARNREDYVNQKTLVDRLRDIVQSELGSHRNKTQLYSNLRQIFEIASFEMLGVSGLLLLEQKVRDMVSESNNNTLVSTECKGMPTRTLKNYR